MYIVQIESFNGEPFVGRPWGTNITEEEAGKWGTIFWILGCQVQQNWYSKNIKSKNLKDFSFDSYVSLSLQRTLNTSYVVRA